ncbi:MAG: histidinol phosphatase, partial [Acidobacteriota bacterium]
LRKPVGEMYPEPRILRRLIEAGVGVTFSSDAHAPAEVGWGYDRTVPEAIRCGAREFVTFEGRRKCRNSLEPFASTSS